MKYLAWVLVGASALLCACGGGGGTTTNASQAGERLSAHDISTMVGCVAFQQDQDTELFVREQGGCAFAEDEVDTYPMTIYTFTDTAARDNWLQAASAFGPGPMVVGSGWVVVVETNCDPADPCSAEDRASAIAAKLGGEVR
jgi:hypothetical protein